MAQTARIAAGSIGIGLAVLGLKAAAAWLTGSVALYADAVESVVNVAAAGIAYAGIAWSRRPADGNHPYGHDKGEYLSAVVEGVLVVLAALAIVHAAGTALLAGRAEAAPVSAAGLAINGLASLINGLWCFVLLREGRRLLSPALVADGEHLRADVVSSLGVIAGLLLAAATGLWWLDPLLALLVGVNVLVSGWRLVKASLGGLMDEAVPAEVLARINQRIRDHAGGAIEAHDVRTRQAGRRTFVEFHLVVPGALSVEAAHAICDRVEAALREELDEAIITIHVEPEHKAKRQGVAVA